MHGQGYMPPPQRPSHGVQIGLRVLFVALAVLSIGFLAWTALLRLALTTATAELSQLHGRSPTVHELAEKLAISEEEVLEGLESANAYSTLSLDVPDTDDESPAVADTLGAEDEALEGVEYRESLKPLLEDLPPREKRILLLRFFGNMTQSQIAQEVGISQMHVSRLLARTLAQLREKLLVEE